MKNIVVCCDGTMAKYEANDKNTNVVRLFERLGSDGAEQVSYYDPGVGTYSPLLTPLGRWIARGLTSISGVGITGAGLNGNIEEAYKYLMGCYEPGDRVFLFGYSRGAHTVRVLAGMLHKCGLLTKGSDNLIPYMISIYGDKNASVAAGFKTSFSRKCKPHFIGVWDTVASVGWICRKQFSNNKLNPDVAHGYQALSVDERRWHFRPSLWDEQDIPEGQVIEQVWFPGCHSDVGGQDVTDRRVPDIALEWMLRRAEGKGLILRTDWQESLYPDPLGEIKRSDRHFWKLGAKGRSIPSGSKIHQGVFHRLSNSGNCYHPRNIPELRVEVD